MTAGQPAKVLLVDDRKENLIALEAILQGLPVETVGVTTGEDALKRLLLDNFAAILLDANMPGMDGYETAGHIKQRERTRNIPIIFLTAEGYDARLAFRGYQAGAVDYITKPFDPWVLRSKVEVFVDMWSMNAQLAARVADYQALRERLDHALDLLGATPPDVEAAAAALRDAVSRMQVARTVTG
ncbi:MAG: response regulator receiver protein [Pseudonocardia sp.]|nr:response regulator receiver protein [Pseudonocardia sp.]